MKKHYFLLGWIAVVVMAVGMLVGCNSAPEPVDPEEDLNKETELDVDNTKARSDNNRVIYEMNLYNFTSEGTLKAAEAKLVDLRRLGVDIVWLMPIQTRSTEGKIGSLGSPYALRNYTEVNPQHGTLDDLKSFVDKAHTLRMEVWLDWVPNHTGLDHVWVTDHPSYYKKQDGKMVHPNNYADVYQLDYTNMELRAAMREAMIYWVKEANVDGFRCDYVSSPDLPADFWSDAIPKIQAAAGRKIWMLGESDFQPEKPALLTVGFDYDYTVGYHYRLKANVGKSESAAKLKTQCRSLVTNSSYANMDRMVYLTNHDDIGDNTNYFGHFGANVAPLTVVEFTLYGMPLLYNGQEIGYRKVQDYFNRDVINWSSPNAQLQNTIRTLVALRHLEPALGSGTKADRPTTTFLDCSNSAFMAYKKEKDNNLVLVVVSLAADSATCEIKGIDEGIYMQWLNSETIAEKVSKKKVKLTETTKLWLPKKGYAVFVKLD